MDTDLNFDVEIMTSEVMKKLNIPILTKKSNKTMNSLSSSRLISNVKVEDLIIDLRYQRKPNPQKVAKIIRDFDPNALGVLICSMREDGTVAVIDGGHRIAALNAMGLGTTDVRCLVFFDLSLDQEAEMFTTLNDNRTKPKTSDIFKSKVIAKDEDALVIDSILKNNHLELSNGPAMNGIRAIGTLTNIYKRHGADVLNNTLRALRLAFDSHSTSFSDQALIAVSSVFARYGLAISFDRVVATLKTYGNASIWASKGATVAKQANFKHSYLGMLFVFCGDYNKRLKNNRINISEMMS